MGRLSTMVLERLRSVSVLAPPKIRIWLIVGASCLLFLTVVYIAIPSAQVRVWPRETAIYQTSNIILVQSGVQLPERQVTLPLQPIIVTVHYEAVFDRISEKFIGQNARVPLTIMNETEEPFSLRAGTRFVNQAGMVFRITESVTVPPRLSPDTPGQAAVDAVADPEDTYGQITGERGNLPEGVRWEIPGLPAGERARVYARNLVASTGGTTVVTKVLQERDLEIAETFLRRELLRSAKLRVQERLGEISQLFDQHLVILPFEDLTRTAFTGIVLPSAFLGQEITTVPIEGNLDYTVLAYDRSAVLKLLERGLRDHISEGKLLVSESISDSGLSVYVIAYDDDLQWVKVTAELLGKERFQLHPVTEEGVAFAERLRTGIAGRNREDALHIVQNFPEVERVEITLWPPWQDLLPTLPNHIVLLPQL